MNEIKTMGGMLNILDKMLEEPIETFKKKKVCPTHGEYEFEVSRYSDGHENYNDTCPMCEKEKQEREEKARQEKWEKDYQEQLLKKYTESRIDPKYFEMTFDDFETKTKGQECAKKAVQEMVESRSGKVILLGSFGVGKTMLANIACKTLGGKIFTMYEIANTIRRSYVSGNNKSELDIVSELAELPFLTIDEVGKISNTEAVRNWFSYIIDKRHIKNLPTLIIGNLHLKSQCKDGGCNLCFENYFGGDVLSRFTENTKIVIIKSPDERTKTNTLEISGDK